MRGHTIAPRLRFPGPDVVNSAELPPCGPFSGGQFRFCLSPDIKTLVVMDKFIHPEALTAGTVIESSFRAVDLTQTTSSSARKLPTTQL
jgi:hypothetical protein